MDDIYYNKILNRIIQGRLRIRLGDLVLFIHEPDMDILEESYEVYEQAKEKSYFSGNYLDRDIVNILVENDLWTPLDDKQCEKISKDIEKLKMQAYQSFFRKKELQGIKRSIRLMEKKLATIAAKKKSLDHLTCSGVAAFARKCWIIEQTTKTQDGNLYNFNKLGVTDVLDVYSENAIKPEEFRKIARDNPWRIMWNSSKKRGDVFGKPSIHLDSNQLSLISYSQLYDNVYSSPDQPAEEIVEDDDCLDGWFLVQKEKYEKEKKQKAVDESLSNSKIANSQEVMLVANSQEEAQEIYGLNPDHSRGIIRQRQEQIQNSDGNLNFKDLHDVKQERFMNAVNQGTQAIKSKGR